MTAQPMSTGTVGIVLVSHSAELAAGTAHLAAMRQERFLARRGRWLIQRP